MILRKQELEKAKERYITEVVIDNGSEGSKEAKKILNDLVDTFITNWMLCDTGYDVSLLVYLVFAKKQLDLIKNNALKQGATPEQINVIINVLGGYLGLVYEMYFEEKEVAGTC